MNGLPHTELRFSPEKGRYVVAKDRIGALQRIVKDAPLLAAVEYVSTRNDACIGLSPCRL